MNAEFTSMIEAEARMQSKDYAYVLHNVICASLQTEYGQIRYENRIDRINYLAQLQESIEEVLGA